MITKELVKVAHGLDMQVHDHLIIGREGHYSFRAEGKL